MKVSCYLLTLKFCWLFIWGVLFSTFSVAQPITISVDRNTANYQPGETIQFNLQANTTGIVSYFIQQDQNSSILDQGTIAIEDGQFYSILYKSAIPGFILCTVLYNNEPYIASASVAPTDIQPVEDEPVDFMIFWNDALTQLSNIPIEMEVVFLEEKEYITNYTLSLATVNDRRVYGYVSVPKGDGPFPGIVTMPPFGTVDNIATPAEQLAERGGAISVSISIHNTPANMIDPNSYEPDVINNPDSLYYKLAILAGVRAIDYIFSRPDFDGVNIGVNGVSQGGGLAMCVAGLDQRVKLLAYSNSALCEHNGLKYDRGSGFPYYLRNSENLNDPIHFEETSNALKYIDAMYFCKRFTGPSLGVTGFLDTICPSSTVFAAFNQLKGPKILVHDKDLSHSHPGEYWNDRLNFYRRHFPSMTNPPWPWPGTSVGYHIDAGNNTNASIGQSVSLTGWVENDTEINPDWPVEWRLEEGDGKVEFSDPNLYNTSVTFSKPGTYLLKFTAFDYEKLENEGKYISLTDYVEVIVN